MKLDAFQEKAVQAIQANKSVLVSAPTGAGKTLIAEVAIEQAMARGQEAIYTGPLKALSNQKYRDFCARYGEEKIGIVTGDVSINPHAPLVIMTTEIYRNRLFEDPLRLSRVSWVIFDEVHYLDDPERGTVWEEALLFTPPSIHILALSATVPNVHELAAWLTSIHNRPLETVIETERPVPLEHFFQCQGKILPTLDKLRREGYLGRDTWFMPRRHQPFRHGRSRHRPWRAGPHMQRAKPNRLDTLLAHVRHEQELPVIYFVFGRRRSEELAWEAARHFEFLRDEERALVLERFDALAERHHLKGEPSAHTIRELLHNGIAYHHAGMLPSLKEVVEQLFTSRLIKLIFTTETFALGINMPARAVVLDELKKFYGTHVGLLKTRDFYQMAGRAGRRGMDEKGAVYTRVNPHDVSFPEVERVLRGQPEPVTSQFNSCYATLLSIYRQRGEALLDMYPRTFHFFQASGKGRRRAEDLMRAKLSLLKSMNYIDRGALTVKGEFASALYGYELPLSEMEEDGFLLGLRESELAAVLGALVYEPRKTQEVPHLPRAMRSLVGAVEAFARTIFKKEHQARVTPYTKRPYFHLARAIQAWADGADFAETLKLTDIDEGTVVRYFRMVIQLAREIQAAPQVPSRLKETSSRLIGNLNRGVVDAEKQLRA